MAVVINCAGTAYEIGRQYAEQATNDLLRAADRFFALFTAAGIQRDHLASTAIRTFLAPSEAFDADAVAFIRGKADGLGRSFKETFALHAMLEIAYNFGNVQPMCTSFAASGAATADGRTIIGQNIDWHPDDAVHVLRMRFPDGFERFTVALGGNPYYHLTVAGYANAANLTVSRLLRPDRHVPIGVYIWRVMRQPSFRAAVDVLETVARGFGYFHLASDDGQMVGVESDMEKTQRIAPRNDILVHANHYCTPELAIGDLAFATMPCSFDRQARLLEIMETQHGHLTHTSMMTALADHANASHSICRHVDTTIANAAWIQTSMSLVMLPADRVLFACWGPPCRGEFQEFAL